MQERGGELERERKMDRQTSRDTCRQIEKNRDGQTEIDIQTWTDREISKQG
jgi:hypothetical protein